jgi:hypothetical protein
LNETPMIDIRKSVPGREWRSGGVEAMHAVRGLLLLKDACKNYDIRRPIVGSDRVRACVRSLEQGYYVDPPPDRPVPECFPSSRGEISFLPLFFCFALSRFSHPLPRTGWLRNEGTVQHAYTTTALRAFIYHSQSDDVPYDASPFINHSSISTLHRSACQ